MLASGAKICVPRGWVQNKLKPFIIIGRTPMPREVVSELAPTGVLRAAINMGNFLLVTGKNSSGDPTGVSPDMAAAIERQAS